jgi:hypothetical protein
VKEVLYLGPRHQADGFKEVRTKEDDSIYGKNIETI